MQPYLSEENERGCPWEEGLSPRARRVGLLVILLGIAGALGAWGVMGLWSHRAFVGGTVTLDGRPLPNARVRLQSRAEIGGGGTHIDPDGRAWVSDAAHSYSDYEATADREGRYRLNFLPPGNYAVFVTRAGEEKPYQ